MNETDKNQTAVDERANCGSSIYSIDDLKNAKALLETLKKMHPEKKFFLSDFL